MPAIETRLNRCAVNTITTATWPNEWCAFHLDGQGLPIAITAISFGLGLTSSDIANNILGQLSIFKNQPTVSTLDAVTQITNGRGDADVIYKTFSTSYGGHVEFREPLILEPGNTYTVFLHPFVFSTPPSTNATMNLSVCGFLIPEYYLTPSHLVQRGGAFYHDENWLPYWDTQTPQEDNSCA